jgi:fructose-1,6-bisphosphatase/inositol monophosphatase family enzyme
MVTEMDRAAERHIVQRLRAARPGDGFLGEEGARETGDTGVRWLVDPLDGTTNYLYGVPAFGVSIAAEVDGAVQVACVHDPSHAETFTAVRGDGAYCRGQRLEVSAPATLASALIGTGFSYLPERRAIQAAVLARLLGQVRDVRRVGAASIDLCWLAAGRLDGYYERGLAPWDFAAGALIASEAGADVSDLGDGPPSTDIVVAAGPTIAGPLRTLIAEAEAAVAGEI